MKKMTSYGYKALCQVLGLLAMVAGWWISMLNISIDRYAGSDFTNFWTFMGLALILLGAFVPQVLISMHNRKRQSQQLAAQEALANQVGRPMPPAAP